MPPGNRKPTNASDLLLSELISEGMQRAKLDMNIVEFATDILEIELWPTQRAILKALYNLPYERGKWVDLFKGTPEEIRNKLAKYNKTTEDYWDEREILQTWAIEGKTTWVEGQHYQELSLEAGMRSSKTAIISVVCAYEYFKLIQHPDPAKEFGLMAGSPIHLLVLATTEVQSKDTLFANIKGRLEQAPYFQGLRQQGKLIINTLDIQYPSKNITIWAGHSNSSGLVGRTLMVFAMDEANRFGIEGASGQSGVDLYANVGKGTLTLSRFGSKKIVISSAWCEGDLTDRLFGNAEGEASHILAFRLATWDMNPEFAILKEEHPSIKAEYMTRGVEAMRDYAGVRPGSEENFFHKHALARAAKYPLQVEYIPKISVQQGPDGPRKFSSIEVVAPPEVVKGSMFSFGHCDPGLKHDSFGFLAAHPVVDPLTGNVIVQVNSVLEWRPVDKGRGDIYLVDYENVCDEIIKLSKSIHLKKLTFDHWNCYSVGSYVSTPVGLVQVENLSVGDSVIGRTSTNKVVAKQVVKQQPVVRVRTKFGYDSVVTPHHPFWVIDYGWKNASDLQLGDKIALGTPAATDGGVDDPVKGLLYGYLVAEGDWNAHTSVIARTGKAQEIKFVRFSNTEDEVRQDYAKAFEQVFNYRPSDGALGVRSGHDYVYDEVALNVATGAHNKHVPKFVLEGNNVTVGAFLAGLYEGDGNVRLNPRVLSVELNTVSEQLATEVHLLLQRLGIKASKKYFTNKILNGKQFPFYRITIYGQNIAVFADKVGFRSTRKKAALSQAVAAIPTTRKSRSCDPWTQVVSVEAAVADIVHLEVDNDHSYVGQGVVSHNSAMMIQRIYSAGISTELWKSSFSQTEQRKIYQVLREWIDQDRVRIPPPEQSPAAAKLHKELAELKLMNGRRIDHPKPKGSKDLSDCLACVVYRISQDERRFRYFETGSNNIRTSGEIHTARAIHDLFAEERNLADRAKLVDPRRSNNPDSGSMRNTRITQKDW